MKDFQKPIILDLDCVEFIERNIKTCKDKNTLAAINFDWLIRKGNIRSLRIAVFLVEEKYMILRYPIKGYNKYKRTTRPEELKGVKEIDFPAYYWYASDRYFLERKRAVEAEFLLMNENQNDRIAKIEFTDAETYTGKSYQS